MEKTILRSRVLPAAGVVAVAMLAAAFTAASWEKCEGQIEFYFWFGVGALLVLLALPFVFRNAASLAVRIGWSLGLVVLGAAVWLGGAVTANVRLLCRLF